METLDAVKDDTDLSKRVSLDTGKSTSRYSPPIELYYNGVDGVVSGAKAFRTRRVRPGGSRAVNGEGYVQEGKIRICSSKNRISERAPPSMLWWLLVEDMVVGPCPINAWGHGPSPPRAEFTVFEISSTVLVKV